ncbi:MAG: TIGR00296 family protein [Archaeoglobaceae archaeon]
MLSHSEGEKAVKLARKAIEKYVSQRERIYDRFGGVFEEERGVFVTLNKDYSLRGCIGFPYPIKRLDEAIIESSINAATGDPRFHPVTPQELQDITVEVTVLSPPRKLDVDREELPRCIEVGRHGLLIKAGYCSGLLLPQVALEYNFEPEEFLSQTCMKANMSADSWLKDDVEIYTFEGQIFQEKEPRGEVEDISVSGNHS